MTNFTTAQGVQQFSITIASGSTTGTATINAVGSGAFICFGGLNPSVLSTPTEDFAYLTLTNSTTITATRNLGTTGTVVIKGCIVDGDTANLIKSVQYGTVSIAALATSGTATISAVTDNNTAIHLLGWSSANSTYTGYFENPVLTQSGTIVTATIADTSNLGAGLVVGFVVIEFQSGVLNQSVQRVSATSSSIVSSYTAAITSVNLSNTITFYAGSSLSAGTTSLNQIKQRSITGFTNSSTFNVFVNTTSSGAKTFNASVVEFASGVLNSIVQRGSTTLTGVTSNTTAITSVNISYAGLAWQGNIYSAANADSNRAEGAAALTNGTTVTVTKNIATANITGDWEVFEFPAYVASANAIPWFPQYPNQVPFFVQKQDDGQQVQPVEPLNFKMPWLPQYIDQQRLNLKVQRDFVFDRPRAIVVNVPVPWLPWYPDHFHQPPRVQPPSVFQAPHALNLPLKWLPQYADLSRPNLKVQRDFVFDHPLALKLLLPWLPIIPDHFHEPPRVKPDSVFQHPYAVNFPLPWLPRIDVAPRGARIIDTNQPRAVAVAQTIGWLPQFPAPVPARSVRPESVFGPPQSEEIITWLPVYQAMLAMQYATRDSYFEPVEVQHPDLSWLPQYIDQQRPNLKVQRDFVFDHPLPIAVEVPVPWLPRYETVLGISKMLLRPAVFEVITTPFYVAPRPFKPHEERVIPSSQESRTILSTKENRVLLSSDETRVLHASRENRIL